MPIAKVLEGRIAKIATIRRKYQISPITVMEGDVIPDFALFVDTHRDQPHVGTFHNDIHRGFSRPVWVDYEPAADKLVEQATGHELLRHDKHMFVTDEWLSNFLLERMMNGESDPRDGDGILATSHLRDARAKVYHLKSFRQIVMDRYLYEMGFGPRVPRPLP